MISFSFFMSEASFYKFIIALIKLWVSPNDEVYIILMAGGVV